jgi:hypothetical protein
MDQQALGSGIYHYGRNKDSRNGKFAYTYRRYLQVIQNKMHTYRENANRDEESRAEPAAVYPGTGEMPRYMTLAAKYGLDNDMDIGNSGENEQTISQEYHAYVTAPCSPKNFNILKFWEVSDYMSGA